MARSTGTRLLTDTKIQAWLRSGRAAPLHDGGGLYLRRRESGAFWSIRQMNSATGSRTWAAVVPGVAYPAATLQRARKEADEARLLQAAASDLVRDRAAKREASKAAAVAAELERSRRLTMRQLFERWAATELAPHIRADGGRSGRKDGGQYTREQFERRVFPTLGDAAAADVRKADLLAILDAARAEGKLRTANVLLSDLKQMMRFALVREVVDRNVLDTVTKRDVGGTETQRERVLSVDEVALLSARLAEANMGRRSVLAVWIILSTGCRVGELMNAEWQHVDMEARTWHLPNTKNGRSHTIHLSQFARDQFAALAELREVPSTPDTTALSWLFPNSKGKAPVCVKSFGKQLADRQREPERRMKHRTKETTSLMLPGGRWTAHDLRRTAATLMASLGISGDVIDECLNHVIESRVRRTYVRDRRPAEQAAAFDALGARLTAIISGAAAAANVVPLSTIRAAA